MPTLHWGHRTCPAPRHTGQMCLTCDVGVLVPLAGLWEEPTLFGPFSELSPRFEHRLLSGARTCRARRSLHSGLSVITGEE